MTTTTDISTADQRSLHNLRLLVVLAGIMVLVAAGAGLLMLLAEPESGSDFEAVLGFTAAISGLLTAAFVIAAAIYAQVKNLWRYVPMWIRVIAWIVILIGIASTLWNWVT